ncbi:MAG: TolC family protein [Fuerstiella sp.]|nr:TolC family protein [Fuerstiella sp.]
MTRILIVLCLSGCASTSTTAPIAEAPATDFSSPEARTDETSISLVSFPTDQENDDASANVSPALQTAGSEAELRRNDLPSGSSPSVIDSLEALETLAVTRNPALRRLAQQYQAAWAKVRYVDGLPDPTIGANAFASPIETAAGSQRANLKIAQMLPWLPRLDALAQQACFEAMALQQVHAVERLKVIGDVRSMWYRLYVIDRQIETHEANQGLLKTLIEVANARVATGQATQGDVLVGTLEYSKLEEQLVTSRQQKVSTVAEIERLLGGAAAGTIHAPKKLHVTLPDWSHPMLQGLAMQHQPAIAAARIRTQATRWGVTVAQLKRRPDFSVNASWFAIEGNRPASTVVDVGQDAWSVGASVSIPLWERKYDAMEQESRWNHAAAHASIDEAIQRYDAILRDLWAQANAAEQTATLYKSTILPQAQDTLAADQQSYANGTVDFDRVIQDFRNLLTLELGYHRAVGRLATALARIRQATGTELPDMASHR